MNYSVGLIMLSIDVQAKMSYLSWSNGGYIIYIQKFSNDLQASVIISVMITDVVRLC